MRAAMVLLPSIVLISFLYSLPALAAGSSPPVSAAPSVPQAQKSPADLADDFYRYGLKHRDKAWKLEDKGAKGSKSQQAKLLAKAAEQYGKAIGRYRDALGKNPKLFQAQSSLGYALRKTGDYEGSLEAYDRALTLAPMYAEAIEYRGEAYLALNRMVEAKDAYMQLFELDRDRADELMLAMKTWIAARQADAAGVAGETVESFAAWVAGRAELADQTARLQAHQIRSW